MKKNLYYEAVFQRTNVIKILILSFFLAIASWPRLLLEVFVRKNFGERYFSIVSAVTIFFILAFVPYFRSSISGFYGSPSLWSTIKNDPVWYLFLAAFLVMSILRQREVNREPSVFDFARFSLSNGLIDKRFYKIKVFGKPANPRNISTILEPGMFLAIGILLILLDQSVGILIAICSICYSLSYYGAYYIGDNFIMDKIDKMICNEELVDSFVGEKTPDQTRGFNAYGRRPANVDLRRKLVDSFFEDEDVTEAK
jgi:hypothetical protein